jgi:hypothetical protein
MNKIPFFIILICFGCKKISPPVDEHIDRQFWEDALAVTSVDYVSKSGGILNFDVHLVTMKNAETNHDFPDSTFKNVYDLASGTTDILIDSISLSETTNDLPFQTIILIDETPDGYGPHNTGNIFDALNRMNKLCRSDNNQTFGIGFFARDEYFGNAPVYYNGTSETMFTQNQQEILEFITKFYAALGIPMASSLYDAIDSSVEILIANPLSSNRSVTVVMGNDDDGTSLIPYNTLLQKCIDNNIKINLIVSDNSAYTYFQLALRTGGFIADNNGTTYSGNHSSRTAESVIFHLHDLLAKNYKEYVLHCSAVRTVSWSTGTIFNGYLEASYFQEVEGNYFQDDLYDDYSLNQFIPISLKIP